MIRNAVSYKEKRAISLLLKYTIYTLLVIAVFAVFFTYLSEMGKGELAKKQLYVKLSALLIEAAEPGTVIEIAAENHEIEIKGNEVSVWLSGKEEAKTSYPFVLPYKAEAEKFFKEEKREDFFRIKVEKK